MEVLIVRTPGMLLPEAVGQSDLLCGWTFVILLALTLALAVVFPRVGMLWLLIVFLSQPLHLVVSNAFRRKANTDA
ncbi:hypothetical protein ACPPVW_07005 [Leifsonia sp. McL0607]|uniref:hypothetical protein n=1 Tax=Leifsonia sp. McL0607 TaxID=3415672 RepID=UPI003CF95947